MSSALNPPSLANLNQLFNEYDQDHDGKLKAEQIKLLFQALGYPSPYIGSVRKVVRLMNYNQQSKDLLNFSQTEEYAQANVSEGKLKIWKSKYEIYDAINDAHKEMFKDQEDPNSAAPGAGPGQQTFPISQSPDSQQGEIQVKTGNGVNFNEYIKFSVQKLKGKQIKPFIKITVQRDTPEEAKKIQELFKQIHEVLVDLLKNEAPEFTTEIDSVSFITSVNGSIFSLFVTTNNQELIELIELAATYLDQIIRNPINAKIEGSFSFNLDVEKFVKNPNFNFYDICCKESKFNLKWSAWEVFNVLRNCLLKGDAFSELKYDDYEPFCMILMLLIHTHKFTGKVEFENCPTEVQQTKSKEQIKNMMTEFKEFLKETEEEMHIPILQMINAMNGKTNIELGVGDWRAHAEINLKNWPMLITEEIAFTEDNSNIDLGFDSD